VETGRTTGLSSIGCRRPLHRGCIWLQMLTPYDFDSRSKDVAPLHRGLLSFTALTSLLILCPLRFYFLVLFREAQILHRVLRHQIPFHATLQVAFAQFAAFGTVDTASGLKAGEILFHDGLALGIVIEWEGAALGWDWFGDFDACTWGAKGGHLVLAEGNEETVKGVEEKSSVNVIHSSQIHPSRRVRRTWLGTGGQCVSLPTLMGQPGHDNLNLDILQE
jgi:hypothetical protein